MKISDSLRSIKSIVQINSDGKRPEGLIWKVEEEEDFEQPHSVAVN
jgi:hypothetical protein